jgi:hypothetical protein
MRVRMRLRLCKSVSKGERKCIIKNPTKIEKIKEASQCRLVWWWLVLWMACECRLKKKTKMEKTNYKIMERITLAWGKHKNGKNQLQKTGQTREKLENKKTDAAAYVSADLVGHFLFFWKGKKKSSSCSSSSRTWVLGVSFLFFHLVRSIHPVDVWTKDESFFHPPSSTAGIFPTVEVSQSVLEFIFCL